MLKMATYVASQHSTVPESLEVIVMAFHIKYDASSFELCVIIF